MKNYKKTKEVITRKQKKLYHLKKRGNFWYLMIANYGDNQWYIFIAWKHGCITNYFQTIFILVNSSFWIKS